MSSAIEAALGALETSRRLLESKLAEEEAWRALRQLEQREASGEALDIVPAAELKSRLIEDLAGSPVWKARAALAQAVDLIKGQQAILDETREAHVNALREARAALQPVETPAVMPEPAAPVAAEPAAAPPPEPPRPAPPPQDLTRIRRIDKALAARLDALGVRRYEQIAAWRREDVERIASALALGRLIARQGWIEQAAMLAAREAAIATPAPAPETKPDTIAPPPRAGAVGAKVAADTLRAIPAALPAEQPAGEIASIEPALDAAERERIRQSLTAVAGAAAHAAACAAQAMTAPLATRQPVVPAPAESADADPRDPPPAPMPAAVNAATGASVAPAHPDTLTLIRGIDAGLAQRLAQLGVAHFATIAVWRTEDVRRISSALGLAPRRIAQMGWIEQASMLAAGALTRHAARSERGELACLVSAPQALAGADTRAARPERTPVPRLDGLGPALSERIAARLLQADARPMPAPAASSLPAAAVVDVAEALAKPNLPLAERAESLPEAAAKATRIEEPAASPTADPDLAAADQAPDEAIEEASIELVELTPSRAPEDSTSGAARRMPAAADLAPARTGPAWLRPARSAPEVHPVPGAVMLGPAMPGRGRLAIVPALPRDAAAEATVTVVRRERSESLEEAPDPAGADGPAIPRSAAHSWDMVEEATIEIVRRQDSEESEPDLPARPREAPETSATSRTPERKPEPRPETWWRKEPEIPGSRPTVRRFLDVLKGRE